MESDYANTDLCLRSKFRWPEAVYWINLATYRAIEFTLIGAILSSLENHQLH